MSSPLRVTPPCCIDNTFLILKKNALIFIFLFAIVDNQVRVVKQLFKKSLFCRLVRQDLCNRYERKFWVTSRINWKQHGARVSGGLYSRRDIGCYFFGFGWQRIFLHDCEQTGMQYFWKCFHQMLGYHWLLIVLPRWNHRFWHPIVQTGFAYMENKYLQDTFLLILGYIYHQWVLVKYLKIHPPVNFLI